MALGLFLQPHPQEFYLELVQPEALRDRRKALRDAERKGDDPAIHCAIELSSDNNKYIPVAFYL